jgi:hypothetical protein
MMRNSVCFDGGVHVQMRMIIVIFLCAVARNHRTELWLLEV